MKANEGDDVEKMVNSTVMDMPLRAIGMTGQFTKDGVNGLTQILNHHYIKGLRLLLKKNR